MPSCSHAKRQMLFPKPSLEWFISVPLWGRGVGNNGLELTIQAGLKPTQSPASASQVLRLKGCTTTPGQSCLFDFPPASTQRARRSKFRQPHSPNSSHHKGHGKPRCSHLRRNMVSLMTESLTWLQLEMLSVDN